MPGKTETPRENPEGKTKPRKAVFLDRDGTLNPDPGYISKPEDFNLFPGVGKALARLRKAGFVLVLITNQSGIARGLITPESLERIHLKMQAELDRDGGRFDSIYFCPHHPEFPVHPGAPPCSCRKPLPGLFLRAISELNIAPEWSFAVGDKMTDAMAARGAGVAPLLITDTPSGRIEEVSMVGNLNEAVSVILEKDRKTKIRR